MGSSRKDFLKQIGTLGLAGLGGAAVLSACGGSSGPNCNDTKGIKISELNKRKTFNYVAKTPKPSENCANCALYIKPKDANSCGGCQLFEGPVTAEGYCTSWAKAQG